MFEQRFPKPAELDAQWLAWNDRFMALLNRNPRRAATVLAGAWELLPEEKATPGAETLTPDCTMSVGGVVSPSIPTGNE
jgi:hypothetical protein